QGPRVAAVRGGQYIDLHDADASLPTSMIDLLSLGAAGLDKVAAAMAEGQPIEAASVKVLAPVPDPQKIICVGLNYADHAKETNKEKPPEPILFSKFPTAVRAHGESIVLPAVTKEVDYEAELVAVIGHGGRHIPKNKALEHVAGYCCGHDV